MDRLLQGLGRTAFGMFLFVSILPGFIPIPGTGGMISGPLVVLIGLQLLVGLHGGGMAQGVNGLVHGKTLWGKLKPF